MIVYFYNSPGERNLLNRSMTSVGTLDSVQITEPCNIETPEIFFAYDATFLNADGTIKEGYISAVAYDCNGNKMNLDASQFAVKDGYIVITLNKEQEDYTVQLNVNIYFDVEVKTGDTWNVVDEGKTSVNNSLEVLTATVK